MENRVLENKTYPIIHTHDKYGWIVIRVRLRTIIPYLCYTLLYAYRADRRDVKKCIYCFKTLLKRNVGNMLGASFVGSRIQAPPISSVRPTVRVTSNGASKGRVGRRTNTYTWFVVFIRQYAHLARARVCDIWINIYVQRRCRLQNTPGTSFLHVFVFYARLRCVAWPLNGGNKTRYAFFGRS